MRHILSLLMCIFMTALFQPLFAADNQKFPDSLFGVKLGGVYNIRSGNECKDVGNMPVKKCGGIQKFLGNGFHYYFEPLKEYKAFRYVERPEKPGDEYFQTSFSSYLLPVIPEKVKNLEELESIQVNWEVTTIVWTDVVDKTAKETH